MKLGTAPVLMVLAIVRGTGCSSSDSPPASGVVVGPVDAHCAARPVGIADPAVCNGAPPVTGGGGAPPSEGGGVSNGAGTAGAPDCNLVHDAGYGDTLYNEAGDDDDCKYHMSWTSTSIEKDKPFTLTVSASNKATGEPLTTLAAQVAGKPALSRIEPYMPCEPSHLAPNSDYEAPVTQIGPGKFSVGPVVFDRSGRWIIRYHFYEECLNSNTTPHGHIAFFVNVP